MKKNNTKNDNTNYITVAPLHRPHHFGQLMHSLLKKTNKQKNKKTFYLKV